MDWQELFAGTLNRGLNGAIDVTIAKETAGLPNWAPNNGQPTVLLEPAGGMFSGLGTGGQLLPLLMMAAGVFLIVRLARK